MLELENKKMEEKLKEVQLLMELEKQKRSTGQSDPSNKEGTIWRSATQNQPLRGYDKVVMQHVQKTKGIAPKQQPGNQEQQPFVPGLPAQSNKLQNNLAKAIQNQKEEDEQVTANTHNFPEVTEFLASINLEKYESKLTENGIEDLETILELNDTHLDAIGIPLGYKLKILKRIKTVRQEKGLSQPESRARPDSAVSKAESKDTSSAQLPAKSALKQKKVVEATVEPIDKKVTIEGEFNEAESHNSFLEALNAWRGVKTTETAGNKEVKFADKKPGGFFA